MPDYNISAVRRRKVFSGSAGVGPYACTFEILTQNDIQVYKNTTLLTLTTDYTVSINANGTFSVTLVVAATGSDTVTIAGDRDIERTTDFVTAGDFRASAINEQLDALTIIAQQLAEQADRSIRFPITDLETLTATLPVAATRADKFLKFNSSGEPGVAAIADVGTAVFASASDMTTGTSADTLVSPKELTEWAPAAATLASADSFIVRDATDSKIKRMPALAAISYAMLQDVSATSRILGRKTAAAGVAEECTLSEILDFIGSAAQGDILYRGASAWARLGAGTKGFALQTQGASANPAWAGGCRIDYTLATYASSSDLTTAIPYDDTIPQNTEGTQILTVSITPKTTTSRLRVRFGGFCAGNASVVTMSAALFKNSTADAVRATAQRATQTDAANPLFLEYEEVPGSTSAVTFNLRVGPDAGTMRMNGTSGARRFGGVAAAFLLVEEFAA